VGPEVAGAIVVAAEVGISVSFTAVGATVPDTVGVPVTGITVGTAVGENDGESDKAVDWVGSDDGAMDGTLETMGASDGTSDARTASSDVALAARQARAIAAKYRCMVVDIRTTIPLCFVPQKSERVIFNTFRFAAKMVVKFWDFMTPTNFCRNILIYMLRRFNALELPLIRYIRTTNALYTIATAITRNFRAVHMYFDANTANYRSRKARISEICILNSDPRRIGDGVR
jgi:hypothetical protein